MLNHSLHTGYTWDFKWQLYLQIFFWEYTVEMVDIIRIKILKAAIWWKIQLNWYEQTKTTHLNIMSWLHQYLQKEIHSWVPPISRSKVLRVFSSKLWYLCSLSQLRASINRSKGWKWYISDGDANKSAIVWFFFSFLLACPSNRKLSFYSTLER